MIVQLTTPLLELWRIDGQFSNQPHTHEAEYQITVPLQGNCHFKLEHKEFSLGSGRALVQHPGERHSFEADSLSGLIIIKIRQEAWRGSESAPGFARGVRQSFDSLQLSGYYRTWIDALMRSDPCDRLIREQTEAQVIAYLSAMMTGNTMSASLSERTTNIGKDRYLDQVLDYIHSHFRETVSIDAMAGIAAQSRYHFIRSFKAATGDTPYHYVLKLRMKEAMRLLRTTRASVTDIALSLGYSSTSPFYRAFAGIYGVRPEQCRGESGQVH